MSDDAAFVRDRFEIVDLIHSYSHHADAGDMARFLELFDDQADIDIGMPGVRDKPTLAKAMEHRPPRPPAQTRHVMSNLVFREQSADAASGALYFTLVSTSSAGVAPVAAGEYEFTVSRGVHGWRIRRWRAAIDTAADDREGAH